MKEHFDLKKWIRKRKEKFGQSVVDCRGVGRSGKESFIGCWVLQEFLGSVSHFHFLSICRGLFRFASKFLFST